MLTCNLTALIEGADWWSLGQTCAMSLLVTSCTMGQQPDRLLNKGPAYLRTRTNHSIFSNETRKKSAVELLAASKALYYSPTKDTTILDSGGQELAVTTGQHKRYSKNRRTSRELPPPRSKSEYDLTQIQLTRQLDQDDIDGDENNNNSSISSCNDAEDAIVVTEELVVESTRKLSLIETSLPGSKISGTSESSLISRRFSAPDTRKVSDSLLHSNCKEITKVSAVRKNKDDKTSDLITPRNQKVEPKAKPTPPPRPSKGRPTPTPRRKSPGTIIPAAHPKEQTQDLETQCDSRLPASKQNNELGGKSKQSSPVKPVIPPKRLSLSVEPVFRSNASISITSPANVKYTLRATQRPGTRSEPKLQQLNLDAKAANAVSDSPLNELAISPEQVKGDRKGSLVETLTKRFTSLSASTSTTPSAERQLSRSGEELQTGHRQSEGEVLYKATPVFVGNPHTPGKFKSKTVFVSNTVQPAVAKGDSVSKRREVPNTHEVTQVGRSRKRCTQVEASPSAGNKREKRSGRHKEEQRDDKPSSYMRNSKQESSAHIDYCLTKSIEQIESASKSEMSIESAEQAVSESEISAIPVASMDLETETTAESQAEITRRNSSRSGKIDTVGDVSRSSSGSGQRYSSSSVPRSHSDISFRLGGGMGGLGSEPSGQAGQHSRDSSIVSSHSRLSRASAGADLENFFNQMGLEMGVLEPIAQLKQLQGSMEGDGGGGSNLGSLSSLGSQDAASICSTYSRSDHDWTPAGTGGLSVGVSGAEAGPSMAHHSQPQTSIVERNARIIKWLCNVRKAIKGTHTKVEASPSTTPGKV